MWWFHGIAWTVAAISFLCYGTAKPVGATFFDKVMATGWKKVPWDQGLLKAALLLNFLAIVLGLVAVVLSLSRPNQAKDRTWVWALVLLISCGVGLFIIAPHMSAR
jgi:formate-dependent nitrite reductase membrane component NrfD